MFLSYLHPDDLFTSTFIGATPEECQAWLLDVQYERKFLEQDVIAIADARSVLDGTISLYCYVREIPPLSPNVSDDDEGGNCYPEKDRSYPLDLYPSKKNCWHEFRVDSSQRSSAILSVSWLMGISGKCLRSTMG